nr:hypothetical protein [Mesorhizobium sp.]
MTDHVHGSHHVGIVFLKAADVKRRFLHSASASIKRLLCRYLAAGFVDEDLSHSEGKYECRGRIEADRISLFMLSPRIAATLLQSSTKIGIERLPLIWILRIEDFGADVQWSRQDFFV